MLKHLIAFFIFCAAVTYLTFPLVFNLGSLSTGIGDELVVAWTQNWVMNSFISGSFINIFEANLYYPYHNTLAYSDIYFTSSLIGIIPRYIIGEPIAAVNTALILSIIFLGYSLYLLAYYITRDYLISLFSGLIVIFSPAFLSSVTHIQMVAIVGVPMAILFYLMFIETQKVRYFIYSLLCFVLQTYNSFLPGYFIVFAYVVITAFLWFQNRKRFKRIITKRFVYLSVLACFILIPVTIPYYQVSKEFNYVRDIRDAIHFALQPEDLFYPSIHTRLQPFLQGLPFNQYSQNNEFKPGYLGLVFSILVLIVFYYSLRTYRKKIKYLYTFLSLATVGLVVSLGPALHLGRQTIHEPFPIPLPYALLYYIVPGFQGMRNSARWETLFILAIAIVIAIVLHELLRKYSERTKAIIIALLIVGVVAEFNFPMQFSSIPTTEDFPKVYSWLNTTSQDTVFIEMPIYNWNKTPYTQQEIWREYYGTLHFRRTVNGYTGFSPPPWQNLVEELYRNFPNDKSVKRIKDLNIDYIVVDRREYDKLYKAKLIKSNGTQVLDILKKNSSLKLIKQFGDHAVFEVKQDKK